MSIYSLIDFLRTSGGFNAGSHEVQANLDHTEICDNHEDCLARREQIKITKGFVAKEPVKGHMASSSVENQKRILFIRKYNLGI